MHVPFSTASASLGWRPRTATRLLWPELHLWRHGLAELARRDDAVAIAVHEVEQVHTACRPKSWNSRAHLLDVGAVGRHGAGHLRGSHRRHRLYLGTRSCELHPHWLRLGHRLRRSHHSWHRHRLWHRRGEQWLPPRRRELGHRHGGHPRGGLAHAHGRAELRRRDHAVVVPVHDVEQVGALALDGNPAVLALDSHALLPALDQGLHLHLGGRERGDGILHRLRSLGLPGLLRAPLLLLPLAATQEVQEQGDAAQEAEQQEEPDPHWNAVVLGHSSSDERCHVAFVADVPVGRNRAVVKRQRRGLRIGSVVDVLSRCLNH
mmetsp:Transcript_108227/g.301769  ORF Transcript_108227/g.301769 Transcript_108227/m.301769 type:complete len:320 (-) Transcript_108227:635-1594(-)